EVERGAESGDPEGEVREPRRRHVQVHQPLGVALYCVRGRDPQAEDSERDERTERGPSEHGGEPPVQQPGLVGGADHASSRSGPKASIPIVVYRTANSASSATHGHPSAGVPSRPASHARVAPSITGATTGSSKSGTSVSRTRKPAARTP